MLQQSGVHEVLDDAAKTRWFLKHILPHEPALRGWLARRGTYGSDIDDVIQETYAVFASMERVGNIRNPRAYLFQVAHSQMLRGIRRARVVSIQAMEDLGRLDHADEAVTPEQQAIERDELRRLAEIIALMPGKTREAFILRRVRGVPQREIAVRMGISESTVEKHIARGIRLLVEHFGGGGSGASRGSKDKDPENRLSDAARNQPGHR